MCYDGDSWNLLDASGLRGKTLCYDESGAELCLDQGFNSCFSCGAIYGGFPSPHATRAEIFRLGVAAASWRPAYAEPPRNTAGRRVAAAQRPLYPAATLRGDAAAATRSAAGAATRPVGLSARAPRWPIGLSTWGDPPLRTTRGTRGAAATRPFGLRAPRRRRDSSFRTRTRHPRRDVPTSGGCDGDCCDSETWYKGNKEYKNCEWVSEAPEGRCATQAMKHCPVSCDTCPSSSPTEAPTDDGCNCNCQAARGERAPRLRRGIRRDARNAAAPRLRRGIVERKRNTAADPMTGTRRQLQLLRQRGTR